VVPARPAVSLAHVAAQHPGGAVVFDLDAQGSAAAWHELAEAAGEPLRSRCVSLPVGERQLRRRLTEVDEAFVILDLPPARQDVVKGALSVADVALVVTRPGLVDLGRLPATLAMAQDVGVSTHVILNAARAGTRATNAALDALRAAGTPPAVVVPLLESIQNSYGITPGPDLAAVGKQLYNLVNRWRSSRAH
jgi:chromosome partitioning protein